uniref:diphthine methyl ester synthase n=1 Tax=Odontella aurita TaxID=265563 RepID=A0A7S4JAB6_9STRA|mmetsp:Transcript_42472/g.128874  ORF Transcript_42472/g.128874 Transcript_42472/m.128874 type:complete len:295 (+) Transcript_42472:311-1195(+)|eukprot:CAMPEP_0113544558 /NCGR_PEP_ID=MMETSP0015_2-20120614/10777_1 /TAXON_ID=2838 /ORGANISM="Odontella" /LENGTH=294 /DNA_ID=CAMNT_0000444835 /DNA_START=294 /DNA_END=1178 /DNA_ORIENTATION=- /assembly_acc=CAM_ASM_000160
MVLYIVGLGLGDERDITLRGLDAIKKSDHVFLEMYTSILSVDHARLEEFYGKKVVVADRNMVESEAERIYEPAREGNVSMLVVGDPVCATTHTDIMIRAREYGVKVELVHNASAMGAAGCCGLQLYTFGQTVSIPFFDDNWRPTSFYPKIAYNRGGGMHTLCLLDIKVKEPDFEAMKRGRTVYLPPRYMSIGTAAEQLIEAEERHGERAYLPQETLCVGMARLGRPDELIKAGTLEELREVDFGEPLHCLVICGEVHELEMEMLSQFLVEGSKFKLSSSKPEEQAEGGDADSGL